MSVQCEMREGSMSQPRRPCPGEPLGCEKTIPFNWPRCRDRACGDRLRLASLREAAASDAHAAELATLIDSRNRERELADLIAQQQTESRRPYASTYRHYQTHGAAGGSVKLDSQPEHSKPLHERIAYGALGAPGGRGVLSSRHGNDGESVQWFDPTFETVLFRLDVEERLRALALERENRKVVRRNAVPWHNELLPQEVGAQDLIQRESSRGHMGGNQRGTTIFDHGKARNHGKKTPAQRMTDQTLKGIRKASG